MTCAFKANKIPSYYAVPDNKFKELHIELSEKSIVPEHKSFMSLKLMYFIYVSLFLYTYLYKFSFVCTILVDLI